MWQLFFTTMVFLAVHQLKQSQFHHPYNTSQHPKADDTFAQTEEDKTYESDILPPIKTKY